MLSPQAFPVHCALCWGPSCCPLLSSLHTSRVDSFITLILQMACCCSATKSCPTLCDPVNCSTCQSFTISQSLLKLMSVESVMPSNHLILCRPLLLLPSIFPSTRVFSNESALRIRWPKYWSFSFSINPSNSGLTGLISLLSRGFSRVFSSTTQMALKTSPRLTQLLSSWVSLCTLISLTQQTHPNP